MHHDNDTGLWLEQHTQRSFDGRPALFLDRDGVVVEEVHFLRRGADVKLTEGLAPALKLANAADVAVVLVTNQSGIARGLLTWKDFSAVQSEIMRQLAADGARIDLVLACAYHPDGMNDLANDHEWRKPRPGMLRKAGSILGINFNDSLIIGDRLTDILAGKEAEVGSAALVLTGYGQSELPRSAAVLEELQAPDTRPLHVAPTAAEAIRWWLSAGRASGMQVTQT